MGSIKGRGWVRVGIIKENGGKVGCMKERVVKVSTG